MQLITSLVSKLQQDLPEIRFSPGKTFVWLPEEQTVRYEVTSDDLSALLHETAHAILDHRDYSRDIALLAMECDAWKYADEVLAAKYGVEVVDSVIEEALDTYRDWLHARSTCPLCSATGLQIKRQEYKCLACSTKWHPNEARTCALRRYILA